MDLHLKAPVRAVTGLFRHVRPVAPPVQPVDAVIEVDEFVEAAGTPEFGQLTERADARVRELGFVR